MRSVNQLPGILPNPPTGGILEQLHGFLQEQQQPLYRYQQLVKALQQGKEHFEEINAIPKSLRNELCKVFGTTPLPLKIVEEKKAPQVTKILFETHKGAKLETVYSQYRAGWSSLCISSQSGCGLGCSFCATAAMGLKRNLTADEICAQIFHPYWQGQLPDSIAFMGMGEALANPHIFNAIETLTKREYGGMSQRRLTVSTVGFAPNLETLIHRFPQVNITLSVHSPFPEERAQLIPLENRFSLKENLAILDGYTRRQHRKVYLAYLLIDRLNASEVHAQALANLVRQQYRPELYHISIIGYNDAFGADTELKAPSREQLQHFVRSLHRKGINATVRTQFGAGIEAACGQLHADYMEAKRNKRR